MSISVSEYYESGRVKTQQIIKECNETIMFYDDEKMSVCEHIKYDSVGDVLEHSIYLKNGRISQQIVKKGNFTEHLTYTEKNILIHDTKTNKLVGTCDGYWNETRFIKHGTYKQLYDSGRTLSECSFSHDIQSREKIIYFDEHDSSAKIRYESNSTIWYNIDSGIKHGSYISYYKSGRMRSTCDFVNNIQTGKITTYYDTDGSLIRNECMEHNFIKNGICMDYYISGRLYTKYEYVNGKKDGKTIEYFDRDGLHEKMISMYNNDIIDKQKIFDEDDNLFQVRTFDKGELVTIIQYTIYSDFRKDIVIPSDREVEKRIFTRETFVVRHNKFDFLLTEKCKGYWHNDNFIRHGEFRSYYLNTRDKIICEYENDKLVNEYLEFFDTDQMQPKLRFVIKDNLIIKKFFFLQNGNLARVMGVSKGYIIELNYEKFFVKAYYYVDQELAKKYLNNMNEKQPKMILIAYSEGGWRNNRFIHHGRTEKYYMSGIKQYDGTYVNGQFDGDYTEYDNTERGNVTKKCHFVKGVKTLEATFTNIPSKALMPV